jgi:hypothetical protein
MSSVSAHTVGPAASGEAIEAHFQRLANEWEAAVAHHSSTSVQNSHPAYLEIIGLGQQVVPLLLHDLQRSARPWFAALKAITRADPVRPEDRGNIAKVTEAWLRWGREHGYGC